MSQVKRLLEILAGAPDGELQIAPNQPMVLARPAGPTPITKQPITADQWKSIASQLVAPVAFADFETAGTASGTVTCGAFTYDVALSGAPTAPRGTVRHHVVAPVAPIAPMAPVAEVRTATTPSTPSKPAVGIVRDPAALEVLHRLLRRQKETGASDLHLRSNRIPLFRSSGEIREIDGEPMLTPESLLALLHASMPATSRAEFEESSDADYAYEHPELGRFRMNAFCDSGGPGLVTRSISSKIITADELGLSPEVRALAYLNKGLVLVTGPTGSGKSKKLSALVDLVNAQRRDHIITIEDPIEFVHPQKGCLITQRQVGLHTGSFKSALRAALREDPDVVLVGELRDLDTMSIAIETAETGHLVFGTLHTSTAPSTVDRIIDQFPPDRQAQVRTMLSESLKAVISQTLCKKVGGGRVAALEILLVTPAVANLIREGKTFQMPSIMQTSKKHGMVPMIDALLSLVEQGLVDPQEAYLKSPDKSGMLQALKNRGADTSFIEGDPTAAKGPEAPGGAKAAPQRTPVLAKR